MLFYKDDYELKITVNAQLKTRIKILFASFYGLKKSIATLTDIKKYYPESKFNSPVAWLEVLADMMDDCKKGLPVKKVDRRKLAKAPKLANLVERDIKNYVAANKGLQVKSVDYLCGVAVDISYVDANGKHSLSLGRVGYSDVKGCFYVSTRSSCRNFPSLIDALKFFSRFTPVSTAA